MTDEDSQAVEGEIVGPEGDGQWVLATLAHPMLNVSPKTLYRRIEQGRLHSRENADGRKEVWIPATVKASQALAPTGGVPVDDTKAIVASLVAALAASETKSDQYLERAIRAETLLAEQERLSLSRAARQHDTVLQWIRRWWAGTWDSR